MIYPIFKTRYSFYKSILDIDGDRYEDDGGPDNVLDIAEDNGLDEVIFVEDFMLSFLQIMKSCKKRNMKYKFGLRVFFADSNGENRHRGVIFLKDGDKTSYENLIKLSTISNHKVVDKKEPFLTYDEYRQNKTGLALFIPFYDSFIFNNMFTVNSYAPDLRDIDHTLVIESHDLPFDDVLKEAILNYCNQESKNFVNWHSCYYKMNSDIDAYQALRLMDRSNYKGKDTNFNNPNLPDFSSNKFSFEHFLYLKNNG